MKKNPSPHSGIRSAALFALAGAALLASAGCAASSAFRQGRMAYDAGDYDRAVLMLSKANAESPGSNEYRMLLQRSREKASTLHSDRGRVYANAGRFADAAAEFQLAVAVFPGNTFAHDQYDQAVKAMEEHKKNAAQGNDDFEAKKRHAGLELGVPKLKPRNTDPISIDLEDKPQRQALDAISRATGINFIYDERLEQDIDRKRISLHLKNVSFDEAMEILLAKTGTMYQIYNESTLLLAPNNPESERKYQDLVMKTFYLSNAQAKDVFQQVRSMIDIKKLSQNEQLNAITIRGTPDQVQLAQRIIDLNDKSKGEVVIDVEILEVNRTTSETIGLLVGPRTVSVGAAQSSVPLLNLRNTVLSKSTYNIGPLPSVTLNFLRSDGNTKTLANPSVRVTEGEKADLHIGDRFPIFNCTSTVGSGTGIVQTCTPTYTDIGIQIKLEPRVHHNHEVSIKLDLKVNTLGAPVSSGGTNSQTANAIGERSINTVIRMADGETEMLAGMLRDDNASNTDGYPGINRIPLLNAIFGNHSKTHSQNDVILLLTPHIIRFPNITDSDLEPIWVGTEDNPKLKVNGAGGRLTGALPSITPNGDEEAGPAAPTPAPEPAPVVSVPIKPAATDAGSPPAQPKENPPGAAPGLVNLSLVPSTLHFKVDQPGELHILAAGVTSLAKLSLTLRHGQLPLKCASIQAGEIFTAGGAQPVTQLDNLPGGDCQITITGQGGSGGASTGEVAVITFSAGARGSDILNAIGMEAYDGKGRAVPLSATSMQIVVD